MCNVFQCNVTNYRSKHSFQALVSILVIIQLTTSPVMVRVMIDYSSITTLHGKPSPTGHLFHYEEISFYKEVCYCFHWWPDHWKRCTITLKHVKDVHYSPVNPPLHTDQRGSCCCRCLCSVCAGRTGCRGCLESCEFARSAAPSVAAAGGNSSGTERGGHHLQSGACWWLGWDQHKCKVSKKQRLDKYQ